jgi:hypothetical protein
MQNLSRRNLALASFAAFQSMNRALAQSSAGSRGALVNHPRGQYSFLPAISAYSSGVVARDGYEIVHATFSGPRSLREGFKAIDEHLSSLKLPKTALCAAELRIPGALSLEAFGAFNTGYIDVLKNWGIVLEGGVNPVARTNVAPVANPPSEPGFHAFSYTMPSTARRRTFVVAGSGEVGDLAKYPGDIIRLGDTSPAGLAEKAGFVLSVMGGRLQALGVSWPAVSTIDVYTAHDLGIQIVSEILKAAGHNAVTWNYARPPISQIELEMDLRGVGREIVLG